MSREGFKGMPLVLALLAGGLCQEEWGGGHFMKGGIVGKDQKGRRSKRFSS